VGATLLTLSTLGSVTREGTGKSRTPPPANANANPAGVQP
jgi:hypothetical protein